MRVLLSAYACEPGRGSEPGNGWNWARSLALLGHKVELLTRPQGAPQTGEAIEREALPITVHVISDNAGALEHLPHQARQYARYVSWQRAALRYCRQAELDHVDVAHHVSWGSLHFGTHLGELGVPLVWGPVGGGQTAPPGFGHYLHGGRLQEQVRTFATERALGMFPGASRAAQQARVSLATNTETLQALKRLGSRDARMQLSDAITDELVAPPKTHAPAGHALLWVGRMLPRKGVELTVDCFARIREEDRRATLTLVGDGPCRESVERRIREYGLEGHTNLTGAVPWADVMHHYRESRVFLFTSLRDSSGAQALEAASQGLPMVLLDHHGLGQLVPESAAIKAPVKDPRQVVEAVATAALNLLRDDELWMSKSRGCTHFALANTWSQRGKRAVELYREVANGA